MQANKLLDDDDEMPPTPNEGKQRISVLSGKDSRAMAYDDMILKFQKDFTNN